ncbi:MAG: hypothetical protein JWO37_2088 [Acidimicrobiales bacterium]|jgi:hypothetical protein|nr:hypothetical protein [Acidimicrobiales bacterium]
MADNQLIAIFPDEPAARAAAEDLTHLGVPADAMRTDTDPPLEKIARGIAFGVTVGAVVGAVVCVPLAFIHVGGLAFGWRLFWAVVIGVTAGGAVGFVVGGGFSAGDETDQLGPHEGVLLAVADSRDEVVEALERHHPIRIERRAAPGPHRQAGGLGHDLGQKLREGTGS